MHMIEHSFKSRVVQRQQRHAFQLPEINGEPDCANEHDKDQVKKHGTEENFIRFERRLNEPVNIDHTEHEHHAGDAGKSLDAALHIALQEQQEGKRKMEHDEDQGDFGPGAHGTRHVPGNFVFYIGGPDDEVLREIQVGPEHGKGQHQVAEVVVLLRGDGVVVRGLAGAAAQQHDDEGYGGEDADDHENHAVNGGEPFRLEGHDPIDHGEGQDKSPDDNSRASDGFEAVLHGQFSFRIGGGVLLAGPTIQQEREADEDDEIEDGADGEALLGQVAHLKRVIWISQHFGAVFVESPGIQNLHPHSGQDRDEKHGHQAEHAGTGFEHAADGIAPGAADEVVKHQDGGASHGDEEPVDIAHRIGAKNGLQGEIHRDGPPAAAFSFWRSASGTSSMVACWLSCRTRM